MNRILFFILLFLLSGCSTSLTIKPHKCNASLVLFPKTFSSQKYENIKITTKGVGNYDFLLYEELKDHGLNCTQMSELFYSVETDFTDVVLGILPSFTSRTITIWYR
ncbi:hypothetical protein [Bacteriovorax sp. Seq25_V]|uniref:hypothetical protein n=1 Tax=Bacteriovorax sp. Seq25_V TaxID=1201288 RepID=UPI00038A45E7|nr:hypothetical protein [Bacteriovorax sp. Seq25_V]EQC43952.1 putative lipoprotein [Bacteriovorax sp. Seq25_V]